MERDTGKRSGIAPELGRRMLIGGIDVGHHTSIALLGLDGEIAHLSTLVHPQDSEVLERMTETGNVMVLSTDRARPPSHVRKLAASVAANLVLPAKNMTRKKKRILVEDYIEERKDSPGLPRKRMNDHEKSALASAIFAYRKFRPGFKKLEDRLKKERKTRDTDRLRNELFLRMIKDI
jgi:predicted RNase H-like nuclease (RuvC/YqgF family)